MGVRDRISASSLANFMHESMKALFKSVNKGAPAGDDTISTHMILKIATSPYRQPGFYNDLLEQKSQTLSRQLIYFDLSIEFVYYIRWVPGNFVCT